MYQFKLQLDLHREFSLQHRLWGSPAHWELTSPPGLVEISCEPPGQSKVTYLADSVATHNYIPGCQVPVDEVFRL